MTRIVVTGAAGFIGSNIVRGLNRRGVTDIIAVDDLTDGTKFLNLRDLQISDYQDAGLFYERFARGDYGPVDAVFHQGACSDTMELDGQYMMRNNYAVSRDLLEACLRHGTRLLYASSAAVYGASPHFVESPDCELPLNVYGYSKLLFDQHLRMRFGVNLRLRPPSSQLVGFRYFNVYGPREQHKGRMASVAYHQTRQFQADGRVTLFGAHDGYAAGTQTRDFIHVDDVVAVNLWFYDRPEQSGILNLGTGRAQPFNDVALTVVNTMRDLRGQSALDLAGAVGAGLIGYIPFPDALKGRYQSYTQADLSALRNTGCNHAFLDVQAGVAQYVRELASVP